MCNVKIKNLKSQLVTKYTTEYNCRVEFGAASSVKNLEIQLYSYCF